MRSTLSRLAALATLVALLVTASAAAAPYTDVWTGKLKKTRQSVTIVRGHGASAVRASFAFQCKNKKHRVHTFVVQLTGKARHKSLKLKGAAFNGHGRASIKAKLGGKSATGTVKSSYEYAGKRCTLSDRFKHAKHSKITGG